MNITEFQERYPTKREKEEAARLMTNEQIDEIIQSASNTYAKIFYSELKRRNHATDTERV